MVISCCAYSCTNRQKAGSGISFHKFPHHDPELLAKWVQAIHRENFTPTTNSRVCSEHFELSDFVYIYPWSSLTKIENRYCAKCFQRASKTSAKDGKEMKGTCSVCCQSITTEDPKVGIS